MKGIIFDFNGTLVWDTPFHESAWNQMAVKYLGRSLSSAEMEENVQGRSNDNILHWLTGGKVSPSTCISMAKEKEELYRNMCLKAGKNFVLAPGAIDLLNQLVEKNIPHAIATSSAVENVNFYIQHLNLYRWFNKKTLVYHESGNFDYIADKTGITQTIRNFMEFPMEIFESI